MPLFGFFEQRFPIPGEFNNPFDLAEIQVQAAFVAPSGEVVQVPAFFDPATGEWVVRFTPMRAGTWEYSVSTQGSAAQTVATGELTVEATAGPGFMQLASDGQHFAFQDGLPFVPIGYNLPWATDLEAAIDWLEVLRPQAAPMPALSSILPGSRAWIGTPPLAIIRITKLPCWPWIRCWKPPPRVGSPYRLP
ncbi:MAG: DUF5060 domain-containing protein [Anaerolineae bacterium]|nr:DUF5060 domain-containing protein [Anaerolineae bacterium]